MPYTDDPAGTPSDAVRFEVGDTGSPADLTDAQVDYLLAQENGNVLRAAARAAEALASKYTKQATEKRVGPLTLINSSRSMTKAQEYLKLAKAIWTRAGAKSSVPYAGGISKQDKLTRAGNADKVQPSFVRDQMTYPKGLTNHATEEDLLSPNNR